MNSLIALAIVAACLLPAAQSFSQDGGDYTAPRVVATMPHDGEDNVALNANVHVTFSEEIDPSSITSDTFRVADDDGMPVHGMLTYSNRNAAFVPVVHYQELTDYTATISSHIRDVSGNTLWQDYSWEFTTSQD